ncbi:hypothetical protein BV898_12871 [Hypsibius exemplaris]|uniref:G-protein coupled receptors family 1 profile domain-containing protein n=1 Tax=Hypsibius exemplaris TaxID=2072580 RepID=A0A1W0WCE4_HYPEX|nr:hypothetical protein BV898_12871 [Hypsibius exemplaris]
MSVNNTTFFQFGNASTALPLLDPKYAGAWLAWLIVQLLICLFGTVANAVLILVTCLYRKIRESSSSPLIIHCTALDLYLSAVVSPLTTILAYLGPGQYLPPNFCRYSAIGFFIFYYIQVWAACCLAFQRLIATLFPLHYQKFVTTRALVIMFVFPWLLNLLINIFPTLRIGTESTEWRQVGGCTFVPHGHSTSIFHSFSLYLPSVLIGSFYVLILGRTVYVLRFRRDSRTGKNAPFAALLRRRLEISKTLFVSFLWMCLAMYPLTFALSFAPTVFGRNIYAHILIRLFFSSYSSLNPIFYFLTSKLYMEGLRYVFWPPGRRSQVAGANPRAPTLGDRGALQLSERMTYEGTGAAAESSVQQNKTSSDI